MLLVDRQYFHQRQDEVSKQEALNETEWRFEDCPYLAGLAGSDAVFFKQACNWLCSMNMVPKSCSYTELVKNYTYTLFIYTYMYTHTVSSSMHCIFMVNKANSITWSFALSKEVRLLKKDHSMGTIAAASNVFSRYARLVQGASPVVACLQ